MPGDAPTDPHRSGERGVTQRSLMPAAGLVLLLLAGHQVAAQSETGVIRLRPGSQSTSQEPDTPGSDSSFDGRRRGFDYGAFEARLESLWFQRKTLLADGREEDAERQAERIRAARASEPNSGSVPFSNLVILAPEEVEAKCTDAVNLRAGASALHSRLRSFSSC